MHGVSVLHSVKREDSLSFSRRAVHSLNLLLSAAAVLYSGAALGQEKRSSGVGPVAGTDIVVTARRRDETVTDVPASITAYSSEFLEKQNIQSFVDYATKVPNLSFQYGQGNSNLWSGDRQTAIRGVVGNDTTAYYIDDTPVPSSVTPQVLNLERVEVLKGPQGTLFGASSMGGNMRFITKKPSLTKSGGEAEMQAGGTKNAGLDLMSNVKGSFVVVPDRVAIDAALGYMHESGFLTRRFPGEDPDTLISIKDQGRSDVFSGSLALRIALTDSLEATFSALGQYTNLQGFPGAYVPLPEYRPRSYIVDRNQDVQEYSKDRWGLGAFVLNYKGDGFSIVSSTSFFQRSIKEKEDSSEGTITYFEGEGRLQGNPIFYYLTDDKEKRFTQETRISFDEGAIIPRLSGIAGVFYQHQTSANYAPPVIVPELEAAGYPYPYVTATKSNGKTTNFAVFGELYYELIPKLTVTMGLRQYLIKQSQEPTTTTGAVFGETGVAEEPGFREKQSGLVPKAVISYAIGDRGNIYASAAKGFRPGGSSGQLAYHCAADLAELGLDPVSASRYRSDSLWSYEVGAKSRFAGGRFSASAAAFRMDWSDIQQTTVLAKCGLPLTTNAGKARIKGGEIEIGGRLFADVPLTLQFGVGYTDARLIDPGILIEQEPNSRLGSVPKWTGTVSGYYETPIRNDVSLFLAADYSYASSTTVLTVTDKEGHFVNRRPINLVNANFGVNVGPAQIMFYVKNLFDKRLNLGHQTSRAFEREEDGQRLTRGVVSRPRQMGVQVHLSF